MPGNNGAILAHCTSLSSYRLIPIAERIEAQLSAKGEEHGALRRRVLMLEAGRTELGNYTSEVELFAALEAES